MTCAIKNGKIQLDKSYVEERGFYTWGAKWALVEDNHTYVLVRNSVLAKVVREEIGDDGRIIQEGATELLSDGTWILPPEILSYFKAVEMVVTKDSKGFFITTPAEEVQYKKEIKDFEDQILALLEESK